MGLSEEKAHLHLRREGSSENQRELPYIYNSPHLLQIAGIVSRQVFLNLKLTGNFYIPRDAAEFLVETRLKFGLGTQVGTRRKFWCDMEVSQDTKSLARTF